MVISRKGLANNEPLELIKLAFILNKEKLKTEFAKLKTKVELEGDIKLLSDLATSKLDVSGRIKNGTEVIVFNTMDVLNGIKYSPEERLAVINNKDLFVP